MEPFPIGPRRRREYGYQHGRLSSQYYIGGANGNRRHRWDNPWDSRLKGYAFRLGDPKIDDQGAVDRTTLCAGPRWMHVFWFPVFLSRVLDYDRRGGCGKRVSVPRGSVRARRI